MWAQASGGAFRFGFSAYAVRLLQDVYFLEWMIDAGYDAAREAGDRLDRKLQGRKSPCTPPCAGRLTQFNESLLADPSTINVDNYGRGWLFAMEGEGGELLSPEAYLIHLEAAWKVAERHDQRAV